MENFTQSAYKGFILEIAPRLTTKINYTNMKVTPWSTTKMNNTNMKVTLVTAYFNIGLFGKGILSNIRGPHTYRPWMEVFSRIENPLVVYVDNETDADIFKDIRNGSLSAWTRIVKVTRGDLWAFRLKPNVSRIFSSRTLPKYTPNTMVPDYACAVSAKYEVIAKAIDADYFGTDYFAWTDIGYWRREVSSSNTDNFQLGFPPGFNGSRISYGQVRKKPNVTIESIFRGEVRHEKTDLTVFVVVIPKEGWARMAAPILLLV